MLKKISTRIRARDGESWPVRGRGQAFLLPKLLDQPLWAWMLNLLVWVLAWRVSIPYLSWGIVVLSVGFDCGVISLPCRSLCLVIWVVGYLFSMCWKVSIVLSRLHSLHVTLFRLFILLLKYFRVLCPVIACIMFVKSDGDNFSSILKMLGWILSTFVCLANFSSSDHLSCYKL